jgi:acyl-CoA thioesterase
MGLWRSAMAGDVLPRADPGPATWYFLNQFDVDTSAKATARGFSIQLSERWNGIGGLHGGYLAATILRTMATVVNDAERNALTLDITFVSPAQPSNARLTAHIERKGRSTTTVSLRLRQSSHTVALAVATFRKPGVEHVKFSEDHGPIVPRPEAVRAVARASLGLAPWADQFELRPCLGLSPYSAVSTTMTGGWIRLRQPRPIDDVLLAALPDCWMPSIRTHLAQPHGRDATIKIGMHFSGVVALSDVERNEYCLLRSEARLAESGAWQEDTTVWSRTGRVLVRSRQVALGA